MTSGLPSVRRWQVYPPNPSLAEKVSDRLGVHPVLAQVLLNRDIRSIDAGAAFLDPDLVGMVPFPPSMTAAAYPIIHDAIQTKSRILVYGDYDVDGMTATTMMIETLRRWGASVDYYLPHRFSDGYGLSMAVIPTLQQLNYALLITLDCGVTNVAEIAAIHAETQTQVIVIDHHTIPPVLPPADAMINPKQLPDPDSRRMLCTAGIVLHVLAELSGLYGYPFLVDDVLDLAALGTVADVVPLTGANRWIVHAGLPVISARRRLGLRALLQAAGFDRDMVSTRDLGFVVAPRLNAAGRLDSAMLGVKLLLADDEAAALELADRLNKMNEHRQAIGQSMVADAILQVGNEAERESVLVVRGHRWHAGVIGITASRLVETFSRPVVIIAEDDDIGRGSARTVGSVNIYELLNSCRHLMTKFGGHAQAAGFSVKPDQIDALKAALQAVARERVSETDLIPILRIDMAVDPTELTLELAETLGRLGPFGHGNPPPVFYSNQFKPVEFKRVGTGEHLKLRMVDASGRIVLDGIGFGLGNKIQVCHQDQVELAFTFEINHWKGTRLPQLQVLDIR